MSPHLPVGRFTCPLPWAAALRAAQPSELYLTTGGNAPTSLRYDRLTSLARVVGPSCLAGDSLLACVPAHLSSVVAMASGDGCHAPRCSLAGLGSVALEYRSCHWPGGSAGSPLCVQPWGCGALRPVPLPPSVRARVRCPGPLGACSPVRAPLVFRARFAIATWCLFTGGRTVCGMCVLLVASSGTPPSSLSFPCFFLAVVFLCVPYIFFSFLLIPLCFFCFFKREKIKWKRGRVHTAGAGRSIWCSGAAVLRSLSWCASSVLGRQSPPGFRLTHLDVHGCGLGWVLLGVSLRLG